jgi:hypothetical protein
MTLQQQLSPQHQPVDPLVVEGIGSRGPARPVQECRDTAVAVGGPGIGELTDGRQQLVVPLALVTAPRLWTATDFLDQVGASHTQGVSYGLHRGSTAKRTYHGGGDGNCQMGFFPGRR